LGGKPVKRKRRVLKWVLVAVVAVLAVEGLIRVVYAVRNSRIETVPVPYFAAHTYAELPPWYDGLRSLEWDAELIWKTRPGIK